MIDIVQSPELNLKNIQQIGSPDEKDKIYIAQSAYSRIHQEEFPDKRVFVLMGHTECTDTRYSTFVEGVIPVREIDFTQNIPKWTNRCWNEVFKEIKGSWENSIIVGWALDIKGMPPKSSQELEAVHREQFGGVHQILMLLDSLEQEEYFYVNKKNHLRQKGGFYVYGQPQSQNREFTMDLQMEPPLIDRVFRGTASSSPEKTRSQRRFHNTDSSDGTDSRNNSAPRYRAGLLRSSEPAYHTAASNDSQSSRDTAQTESTPRYRETLLQQNASPQQPKRNTYVITAAMVLLIAIVGVTAYRTRQPNGIWNQVIPAMTTEQEEDASRKKAGQTQEDSTQTLIPVEEIAGSLVPEKSSEDDAFSSETQQAGLEGTSQEGGSQESGITAETPDNTQTTDNTQITGDAQQGDNAQQTGGQITATQSYTVQQGDTLASICRNHYQNLGNMTAICQLNGITNPDEIYVGQQLQLP